MANKLPKGPKRRPKKRNSPLRPKLKATAVGEDHAFDEPMVEHQNEDATEFEDATTKKTRKLKGIRLQKLLADRGYGSRRKMEAWITQGKIEVNKQVAQIGQRVLPQDKILVNGYGLRPKAKFSKTKMLMYNKPEGEICTMHDAQRRPTVFRRLPKISGARWVAVGRLDINTSGLLLFTTNGELANRLMHPSAGIEREYRCRIFGEIDKTKIQQLLDGITIDDHLMQFGRIRVENLDGDQRNKWATVTLAEGRNREVRKLWEAVGCQVSRLTRTRYGFLTLPRNLRQGQHRDLTPREVKRLIGDQDGTTE